MPYLPWSAALYHEWIRKKQENMRKKKERAAKQKRWEMKGWERMRKFALSRISCFALEHHFTPPVADEVKWFIAQRSKKSRKSVSPTIFSGHRKRANPITVLLGVTTWESASFLTDWQRFGNILSLSKIVKSYLIHIGSDSSFFVYLGIKPAIPSTVPITSLIVIPLIAS